MIQTLSKKKKNVEQGYLERFQRLFLEFPAGVIESSEKPDFLIHRSTSVLGIELTELHWGNLDGSRSQQANEAMVNRVVARAKEIYESLHRPAIHVTVHFCPQAIINKLIVETLAKSIVDIVIRNFPDVGKTREERFEWTNRDYFPEEIDTIRVTRLSFLTESIFNSPGACFIPRFTKTDLDRVLLSKENKNLIYREKCAEVWLVIISDVSYMSTWFQYDSTPMVCKTSFDRVFILRHFPSTYFELEVQKISND